MVKWNQERMDRLGSNLVPLMLLAIFVVLSVPVDTLTQGPSSPTHQCLYWIADATTDLSVEIHQAASNVLSELHRAFLVVSATARAVRFFLGLVA